MTQEQMIDSEAWRQKVKHVNEALHRVVEDAQAEGKKKPGQKPLSLAPRRSLKNLVPGTPSRPLPPTIAA